MPVSNDFDPFDLLDEELEEESLTRELDISFSPRGRLGRSPAVPGGPEFEGQPRLTLDCKGCPVDDCVPQLRDAMARAVQLANNAAQKLEAAIAMPRDQRGPSERKTAQAFLEFFCHDLLLPIPWANSEPSGVSIAKRLRAVANELGGGRTLPFRCLPTKSPCEVGTCCPDEVAVVRHGEPIALCEKFWKASEFDALSTKDQRAGFLVHEMLHFLFGSTPRERGIVDRGPTRAIADCYEGFVMKVNGRLALRGKCKKCK